MRNAYKILMGIFGGMDCVGEVNMSYY